MAPFTHRPADSSQSATPPLSPEVPARLLSPASADLPPTLEMTIYEEMKRLAHRLMRSEPRAITLQTTALVHEAWMRMAGQGAVAWRDRGLVLALAAQMMRRILVDHARLRRRAKRGGGAEPLALGENGVDVAVAEPGADPLDVLALHTALDQLQAMHPRHAKVLECRYFGGLSNEEVAEALGISLATVKRDFTIAHAWLRGFLADESRTRSDPREDARGDA